MAGHNAWHSAMFELESGNPERALAILDDALMPRAAGSSSDAADATALLWRLGLGGAEAGGRWTTLSDCWAVHAAPGYWPLMDLHAALSFSAAGHGLRTRALERAIAARVGCGERAVSEVHVLTLSGLRAVETFVDGDYARARRMLVELQPMLQRIGGSHAQLDLFRRMYQEAGSHLRGTGSIHRATLPLAA
jgi:hypothetical protein